ncbi:MAG: carbamoyl-phosphate synthase large chain, partial [Acidobacteriota bacterium]
MPIIGTDPENIDLAEDRKLFGALLDRLGIPSPPNGSAISVEEACAVARRLGYPVLIDRFLEDAIEVDVDALADTED